MKKLVTILLAVLVAAVYSATTVNGGEVAGTWNAAGSPYIVQGDILVPDGQGLTLDATSGAIVIDFRGHYKLNVQGELSTSGTSSSNTVTFTRTDNTTTGWGGIRFIHTDQGTNDTSALDYIVVEYGKATGTDWEGYGGGIFINPTSRVTIDHSVIRNCSANYDGGGIYSTSTWSGFYIYRTEISNNVALGNGTAGGNGGGAYFGLDTTPLLDGLVVKDNTATSSTYGGNGGGIYLYKVTQSGANKAVLRNSAITGNTAKNGGGIFSYSSTAEYANLTVADNIATGNGGGMAVYETGNEDLTRSIFWGNTASLGNQIYETVEIGSTADFRVSYSMVEGGFSGTGMINGQDPQFLGTGDHPYQLSTTSPGDLFDDPTGEEDSGVYADGTVDMSAGFDWNGTNEAFQIQVNGSPAAPGTTVTLDETTNSLATALAEVIDGFSDAVITTMTAIENPNSANRIRMQYVNSVAGNNFTLTAGGAVLTRLGITAGTYYYVPGYGTFDAAGQTRILQGYDAIRPDIGAYEYQSQLPNDKPNFTVTTATATGNVALTATNIAYNTTNQYLYLSIDNATPSEILLDEAANLIAGVVTEWEDGFDDIVAANDITAQDAGASDYLEIVKDDTGSEYFRIFEPHQQKTNALTAVGLAAGTYSGTAATASGINGSITIHAYEGEKLSVRLAGDDTNVGDQVKFVGSTGYDTSLGMLLTGGTSFADTPSTEFTWTPAYTLLSGSGTTANYTVLIDLVDNTAYSQKVTYTLNIVLHDKDQVIASPSVSPAENTDVTRYSIGYMEAYPITFTGTDPDLNTLSYEWSEGATLGTVAVVSTATTATFNYIPTEMGARTVTLTVTDNYSKDVLSYEWYFTVIPTGWTVPNTGNNMTVIFEGEDLAGTSPAIVVGDYIGAFYDDNGVLKCAGFIVVAATGAGNDQAITIWGDDTGTAEKDGFDVGEEIQFRLWKNGATTPAAILNNFYKLNIENWNAVNNTPYTDDDGLYGIDDIEGSDVDDTGDDITLELIISTVMPLRAGWSIVSSYVDFDSPAMSNLFSPVSDKLIIAKNNDGDLYSPIYGIDQVGNWDITQGYKVKMTSADSIDVVGIRVTLESATITGEQIDVDAGWNMFPFYGESSDVLVDMFYSGTPGDGTNGNVIVTGAVDFSTADPTNDMELMKDQDGNVWVPGEIDDLVSMYVWQGYQAYVDPTYGGGSTFSYCATTTKDDSYFSNPHNYFAQQPVEKAMKSIHWDSNNMNTGNNAAVIILESALADKGIVAGDEIAAFDTNGDLVGSRIYNGGNFGFSIWGDDIMTTNVDGLVEEEVYTLKVFKQENRSEYLLGDIAYDQGKNTYFEDAVNVISEIGTLTFLVGIGEQLPSETALLQNYPNPFNPETTIRFNLAKDAFVNIAVYNYKGELVRNLVNGDFKAGRLNVAWDGKDNRGSSVAAGVYFYRMNAGNFHDVKKAIMVK